MQEKTQEKLKSVYQKLIGPTNICKICFSNIFFYKIKEIIFKNTEICNKCSDKLSPTFNRFKIGKVPCMAIYDYDEELKGLIYQFKGCFDFELRNVFISSFARELSLFYKGYSMVPAPSYFEDNLKRGFNHVVEMFSSIKLEMIDIFEKTEKYKQSEQSSSGRSKINKVLQLKKNAKIGNKKILLVDDIYTTGSTMKRMITLLNQNGITKIKCLVICKTRPK